MRVAVMGSGGVGGYFGGLLARGGHEVTFIARGAHLAALRGEGLHVESVHGDFTVAPVQATSDPAEISPVDLVLFATKTYHIEEAAEAMRPLLGPETIVLPLHNGIDAAERTAAVLGAGRVLGGLCYVGSMVTAPGHIRQVSQFRRIIAGELRGPASPRVNAVTALLAAAGVQAESTGDIQKARWTKFIFIAPFSGVGAVTRAPIGEIMRCAEARALLEAAICEVEAVGRAAGVGLEADIAPQTLAFCDNAPPGQTASMQRDIMDGKPSELESMIGVLVRLAAALGVPAPVFQYLYASLLPQERRVKRHVE